MNSVITRESEKNLFFFNSQGGFSSGNASRPLPPRIFIPLSPMREDRKVKGVLIKLHLSGVKMSRHLLWHLIFKGCDVIVWYLLFEFLYLNKKVASQDYCVCLAGVLSESSGTRKSLLHFNSQLKPIHKILAAYHQIDGKESSEGESLLDYTTRVLNVPKKGLAISQLLTQEVVEVRIPRPPSPPYIGVGYKDKGSMGDGSIVVEPTEIFPSESLESEDFSLHSSWIRLVQDHFQKR